MYIASGDRKIKANIKRIFDFQRNIVFNNIRAALEETFIVAEK